MTVPAGGGPAPVASRHATPPAPSLEGMVRLAGGTFWMGSDRHYPEERPAHRIDVEPFWIDARPVTNADFARFVEVTGYRTVAERPLPRALAGEATDGAVEGGTAPGSSVFVPPDGPVPLDDPSRWWRWVRGASWRHPEGPGSDVEDRWDHPVVHVAAADVDAFAAWVGKVPPMRTPQPTRSSGRPRSAASRLTGTGCTT